MYCGWMFYVDGSSLGGRRPGDAGRVAGEVDGLADAGHVDNLPAGRQVYRLHLQWNIWINEMRSNLLECEVS